MSVENVFLELRRVGGDIILADQQMKIRAPRGAVSADLQARINAMSQEIARYLQERQSREQIVPRPTGMDEVPLSFAQESLWLHEQIQDLGSAYNIPIAVQLDGKLDVPALERSFSELVRRQAVLRTRFVDQGHGVRQIIDPPAALTLAFEDLTVLDAGAREAAARQRIAQLARARFDLAAGSLMRAVLLKLADDRHVVLIVLHHIISDGWSRGILARELGALYAAFVRGQPPSLPEPPVQYADYALWQRNWLQGLVLDEQLGYWRGMLADAPAALELPTDRPRPAIQGFSGATLPFTLPPGLSQALNAMARAEKATLFMVLLGAFQMLLARWSGRDDMVIGTPIAGRTRQEIEGVVGFFVNMLPLRGSIDRALPFRDFLQRVRSTALDAYEHQELPFERLVQELRPERDLSRQPIFQVLFALQNMPREQGVALPGLTLSRVGDNETATSKFDLSLYTYETRQGLAGHFEFATDLFRPETVQLLSRHYVRLLEAIVARPEDSVDAVLATLPDPSLTITISSTFTADPVLDSLWFWAERLGLTAHIRSTGYNQVLQSLMGDSALSGTANQLHVILLRLEDWGQRADAEEVAAGTAVPLNHANIERNVDDFLAQLRRVAAAGDGLCLVGICPPSPAVMQNRRHARRLELLSERVREALGGIPRVGLLAVEETAQIMGVGDIHDPYLHDIAQIPYTQAFFAALGTSVLRGLFAARRHAHKVIVADCDNTLWQGICGEDGATGVTIGDGRRQLQEYLIERVEKGCLLCLCSRNNESDVAEVFRTHPDMILSFDEIVAHRIGWDPKPASVAAMAQELDLSLNSFVFLDDDPVECARMAAENPDVLTLPVPKTDADVAGFLSRLWAFDGAKATAEDRVRTQRYKQEHQRQEERRHCASLQDFVAGLELRLTLRPAADADADRVAQITERTTQFNTTGLRLSAAEARAIGAAADQDCFVVEVSDRFGDYGKSGLLVVDRSAPIWAVRCVALSCRVLGRQVETRIVEMLAAEAKTAGATALDFQFRPSSRNVPAQRFLRTLQQAAGVTDPLGPSNVLPLDALIQALTQQAGPAALPDAVQAAEPVPAETALVVPEPEIGIDLLAARRRFYRLIAADVRSAADVLAALGSMNRQTRHLPARYVAPRTQLEEALAGIWANVLKLERVGAEDNFFALGGHSLLATRIIARIRELLSVALPLRAMFEAPTVAALAERIDALQQTDDTAVPHLLPRGITEPVALSYGQERLWVLDQLGIAGNAYTVAAAVRMSGILDVGALERAFAELIRRHDSLRTRFIAGSAGPQQVVDPPGPFSLPVHDLTDLPAAERETHLQSRIGEMVRQPFQLDRGPLLRVALLRLGAAEHVVVLMLHHIITDGWSFNILVREVGMLYAAFVRGENSPLPALPVQYPDYALWQRLWLSGPRLERQIAYWTEALAGAPPALDLPTDRPRPAVARYEGAVLDYHLPLTLKDDLVRLARQEQATLFMVMLAAFSIVLSRLSGQQDIVVGTPIAGRQEPATEGLIGLFMNTLPLRTRTSGDPTFRELLRRVRETALGAYTHQDVPFEKLVEVLRPARDLSRQPVFQVLFALQNLPRDAQALPGLTLNRLPSSTATAKFDLSLYATETADGLRGYFEYATSLFDTETASRVFGYIRAALEQGAAAPDRRLSELTLIAAAERQQLVEGWNQTQAAYPADYCLHDLLSERAAARPDDVAVLCEGATLSRDALERRANQLAHRLRGLGIGPESIVGLCLDRTPEMVVALLGILKAGAAYLPLDPSYPRARLSYMLADSRAALLVTQTAHADLGADGVPTLRLDADAAAIAAEPVTPPAGGAQPHNLCYVIYTSGSTGRPKGVAVPHQAVVNFLAAMEQLLQPTPRDVLAAITPLSFDIAGLEIFLPLLTGARLVVVPRGVAQDGRRLAATLAETGATLLQATPATWRLLLEAGWAPDPRLTMLCGGEALPPDLAAALRQNGGVLWNLYGPTETTIWSTAARLTAGDPVTIGSPIANTQIHILDAQQNLVPTGVAGELYIGGDGVTRGYLRRPALTAERFVPDPFGATGARLYRTGDLVRRRHDGRIDYLGRLDHQVKLRGHRIELGEIEAALLSYAALRQAVVLAREDSPGDKRLVAYLVGINSDELETLRSHVRERLPDYMIPSAFMVLDAWPLTPNGKIDRSALPAPDMGRIAAARYVAPGTPLEATIAGIWADVLKLERVGTEDNFFDLGGHSLLATRIVTRINEALGIDMPLRTIFEAPTVAALSKQIAPLPGGTAKAAPAPVVERRRTEFPLSYAQERLWFLDQMQPGGSEWNMWLAGRFTGRLELRALETAAAALIRRHEILRTRFETRGGRAVQVIDPPCDFRLAVEDFAALPEAERRLAVEAAAAAVAAEPYNLARGPLFRLRAMRLSETEHYVALGVHHIIADIWSMQLFLRELRTLYAECALGVPAQLPPLEMQYADYSVWQREWLDGERLDASLAYWRDKLAGAASLDLPTDRPRPAVQTHVGARISLDLSAELTGDLAALAQGEQATLFMVVLAAFNLVLARWSGQDDVVIGTPIAGRTRRATENLIGFFVNTLILRTDLSDDPTFRALLGRVRETTLEAYAHQDVPFEKLVEVLQPVRDLSRHPLFQVLINSQDTAAELAPDDARDNGVRGESVALSPTQSRFDLTLYLRQQKSGMLFSLVYNTDLFDPTTATRLLDHCRQILAAAAANPDRPISVLPLLSAADRTLLANWNATDMPVTIDRCLHERFAAQAAQTPEAPAVACEGEVLRYGALDAAANRLANRLRKLGVGPDTVVGLLLERSVRSVLGLLGIIKAGGAYLPLDPSYPDERLDYMLQDAGARVVVSEAALAGRLQRRDMTVVSLDADAAALADEPDTAPVSGAAPENLAYIIYTSGSTGLPKGVMVEHRQVLNYVAAITRAVPLDGLRNLAMVQSFSVGSAITVLYPALLSGACLHVMSRERLLDAAACGAYFRDHAIDGLKIAPSHLAALLAASPSPRDLLPAVMVVAGEPLPARWMARLRELQPSCRVFNHYGATETTIGVLTRPATEDLREDMAIVPLGRPLPNCRIHILDSALNPVPPGVVGEIYIAGAHLTRGYLGRPAMTAERFVPDPFGPAGSRLYATSDLGRWLNDGQVQFIGRRDHQVKIRGFRVELGEIEGVLATHPGVQQAVVMRHGGPCEDARLVAYVAPMAGVALDPSGIRRHLATRLPDYMIPTDILFLAALPRTAHGKVDRQALPVPAPGAPASRPGHVAPRTPTETALAAVWGEILQVAPVGIDDNFFALGGHSLLATLVIARIRQSLEIEVPLRAIFEMQTVRSLAEAIEAMRQDSDTIEIALPASADPATPPAAHATASSPLAVPSGTAAPSPLIVLQKGHMPPVFLLHPIGGGLDCYDPLVQLLPRGQTIYGLRSVIMTRESRPLEVVAEDYLAEIRAVQPTGSLRLAGWSYGGVLAYEIARQLAEARQPAALVALIDAYLGHSVGATEPLEEDQVWVRFLRFLHRDVRVTPELDPEALQGLASPERLAWVAQHTLAGHRGENPLQAGELAALLTVYQRNLEAHRSYRPRPLPGNIVFFKAVDAAAPRKRLPPRLASLALDGCETVLVPGSHYTVMRPPGVQVIAETLGQMLAVVT